MEHRAHTRKKTLKNASLILKPGAPKVECIVRDIADNGARIWRPHWITLPQQFELAIPGEGTIQVRLVWQSGQEAGVQFAGAPAGRRRSFGKASLAVA